MKNLINSLKIIIVVLLGVGMLYLPEYMNQIADERILEKLTKMDNASRIICKTSKGPAYIVKEYEVNFDKKYIIDNERSMAFHINECEIFK